MSRNCIYRQHNDHAARLEIWDEDDKRSLWFEDSLLQSEIYISDPAVLPNPINRAMLAHLMFVDTPRHVLLAGCGGGSIARWFHARAPQIHGRAIEISPDIARLAFEYFDFPDSQSNWQLSVDDIRDYLVAPGPLYDFILLDLEEEQLTPKWATSSAFLNSCSQRLTEQGVMTINLIPKNTDDFVQALTHIKHAFPEQILCLADNYTRNILVLAFKSPIKNLELDKKIALDKRYWGLDFQGFLRSIEKNNPHFQITI